MLGTNVLYRNDYIEHIFACQYFIRKISNKYSEYMFAFYLLLWYDEDKSLSSATLKISFCSVKASDQAFAGDKRRNLQTACIPQCGMHHRK